MGKIVLDISMSLDGFITGPNDGLDRPLGDGGERLHDWIFGGEISRNGATARAGTTPLNRGILEEASKKTGAVVMGRRWFDIGDGPHGWGDTPPFDVPCFVLTHRPRPTLIRGKTTFVFVADGIESALRQAKAVAAGKNISVGAASTARQYLKAGLIDEIQIHLVPVLLGGGIRLFDPADTGPIELERTRVVDLPGATHLRFRVVK